MFKKAAAIAAIPVLMILLAAPWVLAQQDRSGEAPSEFNLAPRYSVFCGELYGDLTSSCALDENGLITLPDGTKAPYTVAGSPVFDNWTGTIVGSEPVDAGFLQYSSPGVVPSGYCSTPQQIGVPPCDAGAEGPADSR